VVTVWREGSLGRDEEREEAFLILEARVVECNWFDLDINNVISLLFYRDFYKYSKVEQPIHNIF
jgi:hypothetical protein